MKRRAAALRGGRAASGLVLAVALLGACAGGRDRAPAEPGAGPATTATTSTASTPSTTSTSATAAACALTPTPPPEGQVTFTHRGRLLATPPREGGAPTCLAAAGEGAPQWTGAGDRVVFDAGVVLSAPKGTSALRIDARGRLYKRPVDGVQWRDISFLARHERVLYHPAGRHIVSVGSGRAGGEPGIHLAGNTGQDPVPLVEGEGADIGDLAWTVSGALAFTARHDGASHLHRLEFPTLRLTTVAERPQLISDVAASRFEGGGLAWSEGACTLRVNRNDKVVPVPPVVATTTPVGWLPGGVLVTHQRSLCAGSTPGPVYAFRPDTGTVDLLAEDAGAVAVRAALPLGPVFEQLPAGVESRAPA